MEELSKIGEVWGYSRGEEFGIKRVGTRSKKPPNITCRSYLEVNRLFNMETQTLVNRSESSALTSALLGEARRARIPSHHPNNSDAFGERIIKSHDPTASSQSHKPPRTPRGTPLLPPPNSHDRCC